MLLQPVIAAAFCPQLFELPEGEANMGPLAQLPYSMVFALATLDSVLLYSTLVRPKCCCPASSAGCALAETTC